MLEPLVLFLATQPDRGPTAQSFSLMRRDRVGGRPLWEVVPDARLWYPVVRPYTGPPTGPTHSAPSGQNPRYPYLDGMARDIRGNERMNRAQLLKRIEGRWETLHQTMEGLPEKAVMEPGVVGQWSVKDVMGHVTTWEKETLTHLHAIMRGMPTPQYDGVDPFNARESAKKQGLPLQEIRRQMAETHEELLAFLADVAEEHFATETRFRWRLPIDTYGHYREHASQISAWRRANRV